MQDGIAHFILRRPAFDALLSGVSGQPDRLAWIFGGHFGGQILTHLAGPYLINQPRGFYLG